MPVQEICMNCKFLAAQAVPGGVTPACALFRTNLTEEPIQCQGKIPKEQNESNNNNTGSSTAI